MYAVASESSGIETNMVILWQAGRSVFCVVTFSYFLHTIVLLQLQ
jgi:hypothetical protein